MKLTAEQLSLHLSHGDWVAMKHVSGEWKVFMYERPISISISPLGTFQGTFTGETIEQSLKSGLSDSEYTSKEIEKEFTEYKIIKPAPKLMKAGDKCQIVDTPELRELLSDSQEHFELIGKKGLYITRVSKSGYYDITTKEEKNLWIFPTWAVARDFSEEETKEETLSGKEVTMIVDGKEYTAVIK